MEIDAFETNSKRVNSFANFFQIQDKLNHKFSQADAVIAENKNNKMRRFRIMKNAHDRKKQKVEETQEKKEHEIKINKYWSIIDNNLRDKTVQKKCSSEQKTKIDKVMKNLDKWSKKVEEIKQKKALEAFPETKQRLFKL